MPVRNKLDWVNQTTNIATKGLQNIEGNPFPFSIIPNIILLLVLHVHKYNEIV